MSAPVVLVTGAAGALGTAVARRFERDGARVVPAGRDEVDITDAAAVAAFVARVLAEHGRIDALVHVAGGFEMGETVDAISRASWERMMDLNAWSFVALAAPVVAQMKRQGNGRIVAVSAAAAGAGQALKGAYIASKSALQRLVETLAAELAGSGIAVNSVAPTTLDTPANRAAMPDADPSAWVSLDAAADAIAFLATRAGAAVHGQHLKLG
ncbi:MAG: SDR family NAD(P)-dependent oxidoreductase [Piscinibacter sp.]|uniref:SDR family NAD(P)-dependent oxidoreductase n=1 Tax=Piscinibacter sp. TaxID=1903157 RepID=UPI0035B19FF3